MATIANTFLQVQRPAAKGRHQRAGQRADRRGYPDDGVPWGQSGWVSGAIPPPPPATAAKSGAPGSWFPAGSKPPTSVANLAAGIPNTVQALTSAGAASGSTPWATGQYIQTGTPGAPGEACWSGTTWVGGRGALFDPGSDTVAGVQAHVDALDLTGDELRAEIQRILDAERAGQNRVTLVNWLDAKLGVI
jgi:hypothetical protein